METKMKKGWELLQKERILEKSWQTMIVLKRLMSPDSCCEKGVQDILFPMYFQKIKKKGGKDRDNCDTSQWYLS